MSDSRIVNALVESLENAPGLKREWACVGRLLVCCQRECSEWHGACARFGHEEWISRLIHQAKHCPEHIRVV